ncbi:MAG: tRNA uridine(34) 5-carboxymethylaminomethyl modification radical SAM/GNAT enzyme Elp3 [Nanoarchaeota archaeon]|nr:tRNA uridine(34) 5-carboxymethylaminomethyl modification radical SAM/GNAT enzyme Elp3 [Nanoarchaeota archaeon]
MLSRDYIEDFYHQLDADSSLDKEGIAKLKITLCKPHGVKKIPTDIEILLNSTTQEVIAHRKRLQTKPNRSLSGVAPVAIMTSPWNCPHGKCTMCPGGIKSPYGDVPQSYTGKEPSTMRGIRANYDPYLMVFNRLEQYLVTGHVADKVDLIIMGGTFTARPRKYQTDFVAYAFKAMNDFSEMFFVDGELDLDTFKEFFELPGEVGSDERTQHIHQKLLELKGEADLTTEQQRNETAAIRCIGMTIETKPDWAFLEHGNRMLEQGCTRVELGVQGMHDEQLEVIHRGHTVADNIKSIQILKDLGFKLNYHMMIGLPTANHERDEKGQLIPGPKVTVEQDIADLKQLFSDNNYRPDMIKIYPCMVMPGTELLEDYQAGRFTPVTTSEAAEIISEVLPYVEPYCRVMRVQRDIPTYQTTAGVDKTNLRQYVDELMKEKGFISRDIRARESGRKTAKNEPKVELLVQEYGASEGTEFFISYEDTANDVLYGFVRLRFPGQQLREEITPTTAIIRELHVYGSAVAIGHDDQDSSQHKGYGKKLLAKAEEIAKERGYDHMVVISGVGVREYYRKSGYETQGPYVGKRL